MCEIPEEILVEVLSHCDPGTLLHASEVNPRWLHASELSLRFDYEEDLCAMLRAMRMSPRAVPRHWLHRYSTDTTFRGISTVCTQCGRRVDGLLTCGCHGVARFPWARVLTGPITAMACILMLFAP